MTVLYSGSPSVFAGHRDLLDRWGRSTFFGADAGLAPVYDMAIRPRCCGPVHDLVRRQIADGHGDLGTARIFEELRSTR